MMTCLIADPARIVSMVMDCSWRANSDQGSPRDSYTATIFILP